MRTKPWRQRNLETETGHEAWMNVARLHKPELVAVVMTGVREVEKDIKSPRGTHTSSNMFSVCGHPGLLQ